MIERIVIQNYKSIKDARIDLRSINVLIGENGAGKSNFISFFELVKALYDTKLSSYMLSNGGISSKLYQGLKHSNYIKGIIDYNNTDAFFFELKPRQGGEMAYVSLTGDYFNTHNFKYKNYKNWNKIIWDKDVEESKISELKDPRAKYIRNILESFIVYHFHDTCKTSPMRQYCSIDDNSSLRYDASNLPAVLYRLKEMDSKTFTLIENTVRTVAPYFKRFKLAPMAINPSKIKLEWEENDSDMYLDAHSLSDGTLRFIALTTLLLQSRLPKTIIIDEPELGLHPAAMTKLGAMIKLASKKSQIIIATQSVELINNFSIDDLIIVGREGNQSTFNRLNESDFSLWLESYSVGELWDKNVLGGRP